MTKDGKTAVIQQNIYNGEGQRIQKVDGDETTNYYYQNGVVAYTTDANGEQNSQNLIGTDGNVLATERFQQNATQYYLYNKDIQGSTSSLVKEDGSADAIYQYTDFGETMIQGYDQAKNEVCYTGGIYDQSTGLYYLNARYYNPVNYVDPSGHYAVALYTLVKIVAGGVVFYVSYSTWKRRRIKTRYATRILNEKYGKGNWGKGPGSEYSRIIKYHRK